MSSNNGKKNDLVQTIKDNLDNPHRGIVNCGNTCYLNSVLQMLSYMPEFIETLQSVRDAEYSDKTNTELQIQNKNKENATKMLNIFSELYDQEKVKEAYDNQPNIKDVLQITDDKGIKIKMTAQQDAEEFLNKLFDKLNIDKANDLNKLPFMKVINREYIECIDKKIIREKEHTDEAQLMIKLEIPTDNRTYSISTLIENTRSPEKLESPIKGCGPSVVNGKTIYAEKTTTPVVNENNKYVIIHLKRFKVNNGKFAKINKEITIDESITMFNDKGNNVQYNLYGVIWHSGSLNGGHYKFFKRVNTGYIEYNDEDVKNNKNPENINQNAYIIVYKRASPALASSAPPMYDPEGAGSKNSSGSDPKPIVKPSAPAVSPAASLQTQPSTLKPQGAALVQQSQQQAQPQQPTKRPDEAIQKTKIVTLGSQTYILPIDKENNDFRKDFFTALKSLQDPVEIQEQLQGYLTQSELDILTNTGFYNPRDPQFLLDNAQHMAAFFEALPNCTTDTAVMLDRRCEKSYYLIYALLFNAASQAAERMKATAERAMTDMKMLGIEASVDGISRLLEPGKDDAVRQLVLKIIKLHTKGQEGPPGFTAVLNKALEKPGNQQRPPQGQKPQPQQQPPTDKFVKDIIFTLNT